MKNKLLNTSAIFALIGLFFINASFLVSFAQESNADRENGASPTETPSPQQSYQDRKNKAHKSYDDLPGAFEDIVEKEQQCLPEDLIKGYFYTIIEEPLTNEKAINYTELKKRIDRGDRFISKICYRNSMQYSIEANNEVFYFSLDPVLAIKCSQKAKDFYNEYSDKLRFNDLQIAYHCSPVQVFLSKGGTSLLEGYIRTIYTYIASIAGIIAVSIIIISGIQISASGGDSTKIEEAKKRIIKAFMGIAIMFLSGIILYTINPNFFVRNTSTVEKATEAITTGASTGSTGIPTSSSTTETAETTSPQNTPEQIVL